MDLNSESTSEFVRMASFEDKKVDRLLTRILSVIGSDVWWLKKYNNCHQGGLTIVDKVSSVIQPAKTLCDMDDLLGTRECTDELLNICADFASVAKVLTPESIAKSLGDLEKVIVEHWLAVQDRSAQAKLSEIEALGPLLAEASVVRLMSSCISDATGGALRAHARSARIEDRRRVGDSRRPFV